MFKSILYLNQRFFNKIELEEYYVAIDLILGNYTYSFINTKNSFVKLFWLFDFQIWNLVFTNGYRPFLRLFVGL